MARLKRSVIDEICYEIAHICSDIFSAENNELYWINPDRAQLELISKVVREFASLGWMKPTLRHGRKNQRNIGIHLLNMDFESFEDTWNEIQWLKKSGFSDITFNPSEQEPTIAGFCRNCCYCLLLPKELLIHQISITVGLIWESKIESLGGKCGWVWGAPLLVHGWDKPDHKIVRTLERDIQEIKNQKNHFTLCEKCEDAITLLNKISDPARRC